MEMNTELVCIMASLGYCDGEEYFKGVDCLESLKDMIRFLRHEDLQICNIRRQMGHAKVLQNDLIPLMVSYPDDKELTDITLRLLVNLTSAPNLCFEQNPVEEVQTTSTERKTHELQLMTYLQSYKEAFSQKSAMSAISSLFGRVLQKDDDDREEEDNLILERILLLIRNLLYVPADPDDEKRTDDDVTVHDQLLWSLHENGIDDLLIYISSAENETNWCMHACEIISYMFREQNPEELARTSEVRSLKEKEEDTNTLKSILAKEKQEKERMTEHRGARHSKFGGAFWVKDRKALKEDENLVYHRTLQSAKDMSYDFDKMPQKKRKTIKPITDRNVERKSTLSVRMFLKDFCLKFLEHGYNTLMNNVKDSLNAGRTQKNDETYYLTVMRFFMTFNRVHDFKVGYVSQTFGVEIFSFILKILFKYSDSYDLYKPTKGRDAKIQYSRRMHLALKAYKELLMYVALMLKKDNENLVTAAEVVQSNIFYIEEYRNIFLTLLKGWSVAFQTRSHLKDLVETFHLYLKLFESFLKEKGTFLTHTTKVRRKVKKPKKNPNAQRCPIEMTEEQAESLWQDEVSVLLSARIQGRDGGIPELDVMPFDPISEVPAEEQKIQSLATIQRLLRCKLAGEAVSYLRASRECWLDESKFGNSNMSGEEEFMCIREIFFTEFPNEILQCADEKVREIEMADVQEEIVEEQVQEEERVVKQGEKVFELKSFLKLLARPHVVTPYCYLLKSYNENNQYTNHCIVKMLHRIAVDLDTYPMLFQMSLFLTFKKILNESKLDSNKEMKGFAKFILSKFFEVHKSNPMVIIELLFWKTNTECYEIIEGYGSLDAKRKNKKHSDVGKWTFEEEQELIDLYDDLKDTDGDISEKIAERLAEKGRTAKQIRNKLIRLHFVDRPRKRKANEWTEEETEELRRIYEEFKETDDPLNNIANALTFNKSRKAITARLLEIGAVSDRKELHKKRRKKKRPNDDGDAESEDDLMIDEDEEQQREANGETANENGSASDDSLTDDDDDEADDVTFNSSMKGILKGLVDLGLQNEIDWIRGRLNRLANDRENMDEDDWQSIPIVPITEDHENALSDKLFKRMLKRVGISPPANEQEAFWRISRSLSPTELRDFAEDLGKYPRHESATARSSQNGEAAPQMAGKAEDLEESDDDIFERFLSGNREQATLPSIPSEGREHMQINENNERGAEISEEGQGNEPEGNEETENLYDSVDVPKTNGFSKPSFKRRRESSIHSLNVAGDGFSSDDDDLNRDGKRRRKFEINDEDSDQRDDDDKTNLPEKKRESDGSFVLEMSMDEAISAENDVSS